MLEEMEQQWTDYNATNDLPARPSPSEPGPAAAQESLYLEGVAREVPKWSDIVSFEIDSLEALDPPPVFRDDHRLWLQEIRLRISLMDDSITASHNDDVVGVVLARVRRGIGYNSAVIGQSDLLCRSVGGDNFPCYPAAGVPGGAYGEAVFRTLRDYSYWTPPFLSSLGPAYSDDSLIRGFKIVGAELKDLSNGLLYTLDALQAPGEFQEGHRILVHNFGIEAQHMNAIRSAAVLGDAAEIRRLLNLSSEDFDIQPLPDSMMPLVKPLYVGRVPPSLVLMAEAD